MIDELTSSVGRWVPSWKECKVDVLGGRPDNPLCEVQAASKLYCLVNSGSKNLRLEHHAYLMIITKASLIHFSCLNVSPQNYCPFLKSLENFIAAV